MSKKDANISLSASLSLSQKIEELLNQQKDEQDRVAFSQLAGKTGTFDWDLRTGKSSWTKEFEALYGYPDGGFKSGSIELWSKFVHPQDKKRVLEQTEQSLKNDNELNIEFRIIWPDKSIHYLVTRAKIIRDSKGNAVRITGVNIDISERKIIENNLEYLSQASKILASSLDLTETLARVAKLGVPQMADWCGIDILLDNNEIKQVAVAHVDPKKESWARNLRKINPITINTPGGSAEVLRSGKPQFYPVITEGMIRATNPSPQQLKLIQKLQMTSAMIVPLITIDGKTIGSMTFVSAESKRTYTQADLKIAEEVASRAALAIHNARMFTDSQKAIAIRDEFISVASHELKTPVTTLKMYTQIILKQLQEKKEEQLLAPLAKMHNQIDRLTLLINDMLNISRLQLGKLEFSENNCDIQEVIKETVENIQPNAPKHEIIIEGKIKKKVWCDKDRISQVITNLLTNAIKYSPKADKVKVILTSSKSSVTVTVQDFGIGIEKNQQNKIFTRFYRVSGPDEKTFPGLGIGLYISSEIIKRHNGKMHLESTKGKGSKFSFTIPFKHQNKK